MRKWLLYLLPLLLLPLNTVEAQTQVLTQWGQDNSGVTRQVYVLNPTDLHWMPIGSFNTSTDVFTIGAVSIPLPTASTLGGVFSSSAPANQFATGINTSGAVTYAQPSFSNLSGQIASGQISGSTISTSLGSAAQNLVFATPNGSSGTGAFRALVANDIPGILNNTTITNAVSTTALQLTPQSSFEADVIFNNNVPSPLWELRLTPSVSATQFGIWDVTRNTYALVSDNNGNITIGETISNSTTFNGSVQSLPVLSTNPSSFWQFNTTETYAAGTGFGTPFYINDAMGNGGTGNRQALTVNMVTGYATSGLNTGNMVGAQFQSTLCGTKNTGDCAGLGGGQGGHGFPMATVATAYSGQGTDAELADEIDVAATGTASLARKVGIQVISVNADAQHATNATLDDAFLVDGGSGVGFTNAFYVASCTSGCGNAMSTSGTILGVGSITVANGIDFTLTTFTGKAFKSNGFSVDNNGLIVGNGKASFGNGSSAGVALTLINTAGTCTHTPGAASETVSCSSDRRLKYDIYPSETSALELIDTFHIDQFRLNADNSFHPFGVIAQEVQENHPEMVHKNGEYLTVDQPDPWMLLKAIQELRAEVRARR